MNSALSAPEINTKRLTLDALKPSDAGTFFGYRSDPNITRYQTWAPASLEDASRFIGDLKGVGFDTPGTWFQFAIRMRESRQLIGDLGMRFPEGDTRQVEIGYTIAPDHQRQGYGTEAVEGALRYLLGSLGKHRVFASVDPRNEGSIAVLRRVGMRQEAHFRESLWIKGEWVDDMVFGILESEWSGR
jgi:RimJ/RimL family protein N-acetyltransferase